jgi:prophage regulatory protein
MTASGMSAPARAIRLIDSGADSNVDATNNANFSSVSLYRLPQVLARIPVSRSAWFAGIKEGRYPRGRALGPRTTVWRSDEIDQIIASLVR